MTLATMPETGRTGCIHAATATLNAAAASGISSNRPSRNAIPVSGISANPRAAVVLANREVGSTAGVPTGHYRALR